MQFRPNQIADWYIGLNLNSFYIVFGFDDLNITKKDESNWRLGKHLLDFGT